ncbi:hypothetical protein GGX14DRAFT_391225 [Mycena pura]|uniref:Uncharacterized protein n=1 Tax=Mycena pura TaxID=153505 RepID=A0AAD6VMR1_9AGAR|nr:hypothetical protein GGX14DRAFT_391225 [Mycena pura]
MARFLQDVLNSTYQLSFKIDLCAQRPALNPEQALIPLSERSKHNDFPQWAISPVEEETVTVNDHLDLETTGQGDRSSSMSDLPELSNSPPLDTLTRSPNPFAGSAATAAPHNPFAHTLVESETTCNGDGRKPAEESVFASEVGATVQSEVPVEEDFNSASFLTLASKALYNKLLAQLKRKTRAVFQPPASLGGGSKAELPARPPPLFFPSPKSKTVELPWQHISPSPSGLQPPSPLPLKLPYPTVADNRIPYTTTMTSSAHHNALVLVNVKGIFVDGSAFVLGVRLPPEPLASQIILALQETEDRRMQSVGKWKPASVFIARSRSITSIGEPGYDSVLSGYKELGPCLHVVGNGSGGPKDEVVPFVVSNPKVEEIKDMYELPIGGHVYASFFFQTEDSRSTTVAPQSTAASEHFPSQNIVQTVAPSAASTSIDRNRAHEYLKRMYSQLHLQYRNISEFLLGAGYSRIASVRIVKDITDAMGMQWPDRGAPKNAVFVQDGTNSLQISVEDIFTLRNYEPTEDVLTIKKTETSFATFRNYITDWHFTQAAYKAILAKHERGDQLTREEEEDGNFFFRLLFDNLLDPSSISPQFADLATATAQGIIDRASKYATRPRQGR